MERHHFGMEVPAERSFRKIGDRVAAKGRNVDMLEDGDEEVVYGKVVEPSEDP